ncbi:hypothetical protein [Bradyrhizobium sp. RDI18]|uniref:hypothetical protein n=1 Tax=Bradyrhizobium sp. RDI18 TaxID=3367400 RepID=UPI00371E9FDD
MAQTSRVERRGGSQRIEFFSGLDVDMDETIWWWTKVKLLADRDAIERALKPFLGRLRAAPGVPERFGLPLNELSSPRAR